MLSFSFLLLTITIISIFSFSTIKASGTTTTVKAVVGENKVTVTFGTITGADNYIIQRQGTPESGYKQFDNVTSPFIDTAAPNGKWKYGLTAKNGSAVVAGNMWSSEVTVAGTNTGGGTGGTTSSHTTLLGVQDNDLRAWINKLVNWVAYRIGPGVVLLMILYAGVEYIGSQGDPAKVKAAKDRIEGSLLGLVVLLLIGVIMRMILPPTS